MYVSQKIKEEDIKKWAKDKIVFIRAGTGSGKTNFLKTTLLQYCIKNGKTLLYLANRTALLQQTEYDIKNEREMQSFEDTCIDCTTFQGLTWRILHDKMIDNYDYICVDEAHYFLSDSNFNRSTDIAFDWIIHQPCYKLFMSATPDTILEYVERELQMETLIYEIPIDYNDLIDKIVFYKDEKLLRRRLLENQNDGKKKLYFGTAENAYIMSCTIDDASFYCSKSNVLYKEANKDEFDNIIKNSKFESKLFCTTSVLDNGINFKDDDLKEIYIEYMSPEEVIQMIGRKRFTQKDEKITVYIKSHSKLQCTKRLESINKQLKQIGELKYLGEIDFASKYLKKDITKAIDVVPDNDILHYKINPMMYFKLQKDKEFYELLIEWFEFIDDAYAFYIITHLSFRSMYYTFEDYKDNFIIDDYLQTKLDTKLFEDEQEKLKDFICNNDNIFNKCKKNHGRLGIKLINGYLSQMNSNFIIKSKQEKSRKSKHYNKRYWYIDNQI